MLISAPPHLSVSKVVQHIKGKSSEKLQGEFQEARKRYWGQHLWARGYLAATFGQISANKVQKYIEKREVHHKYGNFEISDFQRFTLLIHSSSEPHPAFSRPVIYLYSFNKIHSLSQLSHGDSIPFHLCL
ncbi:MAG: IS200/IS605 family transposase [Alphaproteobacteria bacterium]|nr:IS200/IS605 family transposase [Alphaproteobacteria bacterium]